MDNPIKVIEHLFKSDSGSERNKVDTKNLNVAEVKTNSVASNFIQEMQQPFFSKEGQNGFFSKSNTNFLSFFGPSTIQTKPTSTTGGLTIGQPNDKYEVEADAMADKVVQRLTSNTAPIQQIGYQGNTALQTKCAECEEEEKVQKKEDLVLLRRPIFERNGENPEENLQTKSIPITDTGQKRLQRATVQRQANEKNHSLHRLIHTIPIGSTSNEIQKSEAPDSTLEKLNELLDNWFNVPEGEVIKLLGDLNEPEVATVTTDPWYKNKMAWAFATDEMRKAVTILNLPLGNKLEWVEASANFQSLLFDYSEIRDLVSLVKQPERDTLKTTIWRDFFVWLCNDETIVEALKDLNFDILTTIEWLLAEVAYYNIEDYDWLCAKLKNDLNINGELGTVACAIMERDIGEGEFGITSENTPQGWVSKAQKQLKVAETIKKGVNKEAKWDRSSPEACSHLGDCTTFAEWAMSSRPPGRRKGFSDAPKLEEITVMNCWEMIMLAAFRSGELSWVRIHEIYTADESGFDWYLFLEEELSFNRGIPYDIKNPVKKPVAGDIVFFDGAAGHVAIATGLHDEEGTHVYSFWPLPNIEREEGGTLSDIEIITIEALDQAVFEDDGSHFQTIEFTTPNW